MPRIIMNRAFIARWTRMPHSTGRLSASASSHHSLSSAAFITNIAESDFRHAQHPGGTITGLSDLLTDLVAKQLEMLKEAMPQARRIGVLWNPSTPSHAVALKTIEAGGEKLRVQLRMVPARTAEEFDGAFSTMTREHVGGFLAV